MTTNKSPKLSRREALKLIGTISGASFLTKLPSKWNRPLLVGSTLPVHAQTSGYEFILCEGSDTLSTNPSGPTGGTVTVSADISPAVGGEVVNYEITTSDNNIVIISPAVTDTTNTVFQGSGVARVSLFIEYTNAVYPFSITVQFSIGNALCSQTHSFTETV